MRYLEEIIRTLKITNMNNEYSYLDIGEKLAEVLISIRRNHGRVFFVGNGGSAGIAIHMTADFMKNGDMMTVDMYGASTITCLANDFGYEYVFSKQLEGSFEEGDCLIAISSSGNSPNIVNAVKTAKMKKGIIITFSGFKDDNKIKAMGDYNIYVPSMKYGFVESIHNLLLQEVVDILHGDT